MNHLDPALPIAAIVLALICFALGYLAGRLHLRRSRREIERQAWALAAIFHANKPA